jgi:hypothetical protein
MEICKNGNRLNLKFQVQAMRPLRELRAHAPVQLRDAARRFQDLHAYATVMHHPRTQLATAAHPQSWLGCRSLLHIHMQSCRAVAREACTPHASLTLLRVLCDALGLAGQG